MKTGLICALDYPTSSEALKLVETLSGLPITYKVGLELFTSAGPAIVSEIHKRRARVFLDLKFHDIPNTVSKAVSSAASLGVAMLTLHLLGGREMVEHAVGSLKSTFELTRNKPLLLGVTVLTSHDEASWASLSDSVFDQQNLKIRRSVTGMMETASLSGLDGVVCSPHELALARAQFPKLLTVVPGIRPKGSDKADQARVMTPKEAAGLGASYIVVGRPITKAEKPREVTEQILKDLG